MLIFTLDALQITFVVVAPIVVLAILALLLYKPIKNKIYKSHFKQIYGKQVYKVALYEDFYLINDFVFEVCDNEGIGIDHVLYGDKYIYLINDFVFDGSLLGKQEDSSLVLVNKNGSKTYVENPAQINAVIMKHLSSLTNFDKDMLVSIALVNPNCALDIEQTDKKNYIIQVDKLYKLIKAIESRDIAPINQNQLQRAVKDMDKINKKRKSKKC